MPHHHTFYELIKNKARGKSGPLFDFGVTEDVRMVNDASQEKTDSHAGKVVERHWYDKNKHIFPASRWEVRAWHWGMARAGRCGGCGRCKHSKGSTKGCVLENGQGFGSPARIWLLGLWNVGEGKGGGGNTSRNG